MIADTIKALSGARHVTHCFPPRRDTTLRIWVRVTRVRWFDWLLLWFPEYRYGYVLAHGALPVADKIFEVLLIKVIENNLRMPRAD